MESTSSIARTMTLAFLVLVGTIGESSVKGEQVTTLPKRIESRDGSIHREVPAVLVQRRGRPPEWHYLKEMEEYYDDLEDFYKRRDPALSDYYESWEKYYERVRKGRPAIMPPEIVFERAPGGGPVLAPPELRGGQPRIAVGNVNRRFGSQSYLENTYRELQRQLAGLTTGDTWLAYFELPFDEQPGSTPLEVLMTERSREQLATAQERFDRIADDPEYRVVARLSAFGRTRSALRSFTQWLERQPTLAEPEVVGGEEIPLPPPDPQPPSDGPVLLPQ